MTTETKRFCVPDLEKERRHCNFVPEEITNLLDGGSDRTELRRLLEKVFFNDSEFSDEVPVEYLGHIDRYTNEMRKACKMIIKIQNEESLQGVTGHMEGMRYLNGAEVGSAITKDGNPLGVHFVMFLPALAAQGDEEQQAEWVGRAWSGEIIGTYAQTELGHGTFLRGLETTGTYDPSSEEFVLHSPTLTSLKWWPGGLAKTANYAVVMANLIIGKKSYGPHPFMVQLRDENNHKSLEGVNIGEIGPKLGLNTNDNGFLGFDNYRIPRKNLLRKNFNVLADGTYIAPKSSKASYGTMVFVRVAICHDIVAHLKKAVTIAVRYSAVRHQSELIAGKGEPQIIEYKTQQNKVIPGIATVFGLKFAAIVLWDTYSQVTGADKGQDVEELLPELHSLSCGLKSFSTTIACECIDLCRLSCGGHGYLQSSGLPRIMVNSCAAKTYEGENTVLWLQLSRYMMKIFRGKGRLSASSSLSYLYSNFRRPSTQDISNDALLAGLKFSVLHLITQISEKIDKLVSGGVVYELAWNECSIQLVHCAEVHMAYFCCNAFVQGIKTKELSQSTLLILNKLCRLYLLNVCEKNQGVLLRSGALCSDSIFRLEGEIGSLLSELRPQAVALVDSFDMHDRILNSTLGAWDGNVYQRLYQEALKSPLNKTDVPEAFDRYLKPLLGSKL